MQTIKMKNNVYISAGYSMVGPLEGKGPLKEYFDYIIQDDTLKEKSFEKSERKLLKTIIIGAIEKAGLNTNQIDFFFGGDLLNQIVSSSYTARELEIPFVGLYSACATMAQSLALSSIFIDNKLAKNIVAAGLADKCEIQLSYAIGVARPTSIMVDTSGTGKISEEKLVEIIRKHFDLRPAGIIRMLDLRKPVYQQTAAYGHFGRDDLNLTWERLDKVEELKAYR